MNIKEYLVEKNLKEIKNYMQQELIAIMNEKQNNIQKASDGDFAYYMNGNSADGINRFIEDVSYWLREIKELNKMLDSVYNAKTIEKLEEIDLKEYIQ